MIDEVLRSENDLQQLVLGLVRKLKTSEDRQKTKEGEQAERPELWTEKDQAVAPSAGRPRPWEFRLYAVSLLFSPAADAIAPALLNAYAPSRDDSDVGHHSAAKNMQRTPRHRAKRPGDRLVQRPQAHALVVMQGPICRGGAPCCTPSHQSVSRPKTLSSA